MADFIKERLYIGAHDVTFPGNTFERTQNYVDCVVSSHPTPAVRVRGKFASVNAFKYNPDRMVDNPIPYRQDFDRSRLTAPNNLAHANGIGNILAAHDLLSQLGKLQLK
jgi:hypothetical protein